MPSWFKWVSAVVTAVAGLLVGVTPAHTIAHQLGQIVLGTGAAGGLLSSGVKGKPAPVPTGPTGKP